MTVRGSGRDLAISPDGRQLVFKGPSTTSASTYAMHRREVDELESTVLPGTEDATEPIFSHDGQWVYFATTVGGQLRRVRPGAPDVPEVFALLPSTVLGGVSLGDGEIIVGQVGAGLLQVSPDGSLTSLTEPDASRGERSHGQPSYVEESDAIIFSAFGGDGAAGALAVLDLDTDQVTRLPLTGNLVGYVPTGHLLYGSADEGLWAVAFDAASLSLEGSPTRVIDRVTSKLNGRINVGVSAGGRLVYTDVPASTRVLTWVDRYGQPVGRMSDLVVWGSPRLSPDGRRVAVRAYDNDVWILDEARGGSVRLTVSGLNHMPAWSPDGGTITFSSNRGTGDFDLYSTSVDRGGSDERILGAGARLIPGGWSPDGRTLVYYQTTEAANRDLWSVTPGEEPVPLRATRFNERAPRLSPDGRWVAFVSDLVGEDRIFIQPFDGDQLVPISTGPGTEPVWARDGSELFYRDGYRMMAVDVNLDGEPTIGTPELLFEAPFELDPYAAGLQNYDVSLDGQRFLMVVEDRPEGGPAPGIILVENWFEELNRLVPVP